MSDCIFFLMASMARLAFLLCELVGFSYQTDFPRRNKSSFRFE